MIRRYSHQEVEKWADYSGDRNRVHFDRDIAIKNGLPDLIVQGMLILLDAKSMLLPYIKSNSSINFFIKKPVAINTDIEYDITNVNDKTILKVHEKDSLEKVCVVATVLTDDPPDLQNNINSFTVPEVFTQTELDITKRYYPHIEAKWLLMDTLLFCVCFNHQKDDYFYRQSLKIAKNTNYDEIVTYHVAQRIFVSERLLRIDDIDSSRISYCIEEKDVYVQDDSAYSTLNISAIEEGKIIFQSSIACITKVAESDLQK